MDPKTFAVLVNTTDRPGPFDPPFFNPTNTTPPFFQVFHEDFLKILGDSPSIIEVASNDTYAFAHEGPIYLPEMDELWFCANAGGTLGDSDLDHNSKVGKISLAEVESELEQDTDAEKVNVPIEMVSSSHRLLILY